MPRTQRRKYYSQHTRKYRSSLRKHRSSPRKHHSSPRKHRTYRSTSSTNEINKEIEERTSDLNAYLERMDRIILSGRRFGDINVEQVQSAEGELIESDGALAPFIINYAHDSLKELFPGEKRYDSLVRRYANLTPIKEEPRSVIDSTPWREIMGSLPFGGNEHWAMVMALDGTPIPPRRKFFKRLVELGLIVQRTGLPSQEVQTALAP
jgi:hypothetical protein